MHAHASNPQAHKHKLRTLNTSHARTRTRARNRCAPAQMHSCVRQGRCAAAHALPAKEDSAARYGYSIDSVYCEERCPHCQLPEWPNLQRLPLVLRRRLARLRLPIPSRTMPRGVQHATDSVHASAHPRLTNACRTPIAVGHSGTRRAGCAQGVRRGAQRYSNRTRSVVPAVVRGGRAKTGPGSSLKN